MSSRDERGAVGRGPGCDDGLPFDVVRDGESQECEDRRGGVGQVGLEVPAGGHVGAGQGEDSFGTVGPREVGVGLDPGTAGRQLGPDPVGLVGQRDEVGIALASRVELIGFGGLDDLREEPRAGLEVLGLGQGLGRGRPRVVDLPAESFAARRSRPRHVARHNSHKPSPRCPDGARSARVCFQSNRYWAATDWSKDADRAVGLLCFWPPEPEAIAHLHGRDGPAGRPSPAGAPRRHRPGCGSRGCGPGKGRTRGR